VPGIDDDDAACYLGDGPWDMASTLPDEILTAVGGERLEGVSLNHMRLGLNRLFGSLFWYRTTDYTIRPHF
jgi:hypothetical protein